MAQKLLVMNKIGNCNLNVIRDKKAPKLPISHKPAAKIVKRKGKK